MQHLTSRLRPLAIATALVLTATPALAALAVEATIYSFGAARAAPEDAYGVLIAAGGSLYGTSVRGGKHGLGTVYQLTRVQGGWVPTVIYSFAGGADGAAPYGGVLALNGKLYGTTTRGGAGNGGTVYEVNPQAQTERVIHRFQGADGTLPAASLVADANGTLYGTAAIGGAPGGAGTVFSLRPNAAHANWVFTVLYTFLGGTDGAGPRGIVLSGGALYGATEQGGGVMGPVLHPQNNPQPTYPQGSGTVYKVTLPTATAPASESILYVFTGFKDGALPIGGLATDGAGNLFGTASEGGAFGSGTVFELVSPAAAGAAWRFRLPFSFSGGADGANPEGAVIYANNAVFGTTLSAGLNHFGTVFKVAPTHNNAWGLGTRETPLWQFTGGADGGKQHFGGLLLFGQDLYGTNVAGGAGNGGVAFQLH